MAEMQEFYLPEFKGGLVTNVANDALNDEEFPLLQNVDYDNRAALIRRLGYKDITTTVSSLKEKYPDMTEEEIIEKFNENAFKGFQQGYFRLLAKPYEVENSEGDYFDTLYDFENHKGPVFDSQVNEVRIIASNGALWISDIKAGAEKFTYEGNTLPQNSTPPWRKNSFVCLEGTPDATETIIGNERLRLLSGRDSNGYPGSIQYTYASQLDAGFMSWEFDLLVQNTRESRANGITIVVGKDKLGVYLNINWDNVVDVNDNAKYPIGARDREFHRYRLEVNWVTEKYDLYYDDDRIITQKDLQSGNFTPRVTVDFGHLFQCGTQASTFPEDVESYWKNFEIEIKDAKDVDSFETDLIYPISTQHNTSQFQIAETIEAVQLGNELYVATGSYLVCVRFVVNKYGNLEVVAQNVENYAYIPNTKEYGYGGANILNSNKPDTILDTDGTTTAFSIDLFRTDPTRGYVDVDIEVKAFCTFASGKKVDDYDFYWYFKETADEEFEALSSDWKRGDEGRTIIFNQDKATKYDIQCKMRDRSDNTNNVERILTNYELTEIDENVEPSTAEELNQCTKIDTYYGKLLVYKNGTTNMYKSFGGKPTWFGTSGVIPFNNIKQEPLNKILPLRNSILGFTDNTAIGLLGKGDDVQYQGRPFEPFSEFITYDANIGCIAPQSVAITNDGKCVFLSNRGLHFIDTLAVDAGRAEVLKIDDTINNIVLRDRDASGIVYDNKYFICYPRKNLIIKWHYVYNGIFSIDTSDELSFTVMYVYDDLMYGVSEKSKLMLQQTLPFREDIRDFIEVSNKGYFTDDGEVYPMIIETKNYSFGYSQYLKRIMRFIINFTSLIDEQVQLYINVFADDIRIISSDTSYSDVIVQNGQRYATWIEENNPNAIGNTPIILGEWELGIDSLGVLEATKRFYEVKYTPEAYTTKAIITNTQDAFVRISAIGFSYIMGYIPKEVSGRI